MWCGSALSSALRALWRPRDRGNCCLTKIPKQKGTKDFPPGPPPGKGLVWLPSPEELSPPSLGHPYKCLLFLCFLHSLVVAWTAHSSMTVLGWRLLLLLHGNRCNWALWAMSGLNNCGRQMGRGSSFLPGQNVFDSLSLLLCSQELLGKALGHFTEEAARGHRIQKLIFLASLMTARNSQILHSWTTIVHNAQPRDCTVTFITL